MGTSCSQQSTNLHSLKDWIERNIARSCFVNQVGHSTWQARSRTMVTGTTQTVAYENWLTKRRRLARGPFACAHLKTGACLAKGPGSPEPLTCNKSKSSN